MSDLSIREVLQRAGSRGLQALFKPEPMQLSEWADEHFYLVAESSQIEGAWQTLPYQKAIMNVISNDDIRTISWRKAARTGYTKVLVAASLYFLVHKKRNGLIYQPTDGDAEDFVKDEIDPALRDIPIVRDAFPDFGRRSKSNTLSKKVFRGATLDVLGGKSPRNYRRMTKSFVIYDELSGFDAQVGTEGSETSLGDKRLTGSPFPKSIRGSTPGVKGFCKITSSLEEADIVFKRYLPCTHCGAHQTLKWGGRDAEFGMKWDERDHRTAHYVCEFCKGKILQGSLLDMDEQGVWKADDGTWIDGDGMFRSEDGQVIDYPEHVGFDGLWAAYSSMYSWSNLVREYLTAVDAVKVGDKSKLHSFVNTALGECWEDDDGDRPDWEVLYKRRENYEVPSRVLYVTIWIDTQDDRFEFETVGWGLGEESWSLGYEVLFGDLGKQHIWDVLHEMVHRPVTRDDGVQLEVSLVGIDSMGHYTDEAYDWCRKHGAMNHLPTRGANIPGKPVATFPTKRNRRGVYLVEMGTENAKELIYQRLALTLPTSDEPAPGACHFRADDDTYTETWFKQLTSETKVRNYSKGRLVYRYELPPGRRNEALDCRVGNLAMLRVAKQRFGVDLERLAEVKPTDEPPTDDPPARRKMRFKR